MLAKAAILACEKASLVSKMNAVTSLRESKYSRNSYACVVAPDFGQTLVFRNCFAYLFNKTSDWIHTCTCSLYL